MRQAFFIFSSISDHLSSSTDGLDFLLRRTSKLHGLHRQLLGQLTVAEDLETVVRFADDLPVAYEIASIPEKIIRGFKESEITEHFFKTLTDNGYEIGKSQQTISASLANSSLAKHLKVKTGDALLSLTQISFLQDGQAFEYVRSYYVGDRFEFYLENN